MPHTGDSDELDPLVQPRAIRLLKNRPRLVDKGIRREMLEELEKSVSERRRADTVAARISHGLVESARQPAETVAKNRLSDSLNKANKGSLNRL